MKQLLQPEIILIVHDIRSIHNVGSLLRTAEGLGVKKVYLTGYTPHPAYDGDLRLPHVAQRQTQHINKTALGSIVSQPWEFCHDIYEVIREIRGAQFTLVGLEQSPKSILMPEFHPPQKIALLLGREVEGLDAALQAECDQLVEIPMYGEKESFNVVQAAAMALYHCRCR